MPQARGALAQISYIPEATWGTTPGSPAMKLLKAATTGETLGMDIERLMSNAINANRAVELFRGGKKSIKGSIPFELAPLGFGTFLKHSLGTNVDTGAGPYTHTIKRGNLIAGMTIEKGFTDLAQYMVFTGCKPDKVSINVKSSGLITGSMDIIGKDVTVSGTSLGTPTAVAHVPFIESEAVAQEGGGAATLLNLDLNWSNALDPVDVIGSRTIGSLMEGKGMCEGKITLLFDAITTFNKWLNETSSTLDCTFTTGASTLAFYMGAIKYFGDAVPKIANEKGVVVDLAFSAYYDSTSATDLRITLVNTETTI
jgi:hypothetical protein